VNSKNLLSFNEQYLGDCGIVVAGGSVMFGLESLFWVVAIIPIAVLAIIGALMIFVSVVGLVQLPVLLVRGRRTVATVVGDHETQANHTSDVAAAASTASNSGSPTDRSDDAMRIKRSSPVLRFKTVTTERASGQLVTRPAREAVTGYSRFGSGKRKLDSGQQIAVIYLPERPEKFVIDTFGNKFGSSLVFIGIGLCLLLPLWFALIYAGVIASPTGGASAACLIFIASGVFILSGGFASALSTLRFASRASKAVAIIKARKEVKEQVILTVEFVDAAGVGRVADVQVGVRPSHYAVGNALRILYDPECLPDDVRIDSVWEKWIDPLLLGIMGAAFIASGWGALSGWLPFE
jgi:hypothetical protein